MVDSILGQQPLFFKPDAFELPGESNGSINARFRNSTDTTNIAPHQGIRLAITSVNCKA
jgi:hypothetical protein